MLTLTIQSKGIMDNHGSATVTAPLRGPGRPPLTDVTIDDISEVEDPVRPNYIHKKFDSFLRLNEHKIKLKKNSNFISSAVNRIAFNESVHNLLFKPFVRILVPI